MSNDPYKIATVAWMAKVAIRALHQHSPGTVGIPKAMPSEQTRQAGADYFRVLQFP